MRWQDPESRNRPDAECPLPDAREHLSRCFSIIVRKAGVWGKTKEHFRALLPLARGELSDEAIEAVGNWAGWAADAVPGGFLIKAAWNAVREEWKMRGQPDTMAGLEGKALEDAGDQLLKHLRGLGTSTPTVLWLDDAQWVDGATVAFLRKLLSEAKPTEKRKGWPLLVVATHWEREWNRACEAEDDAGQGLAVFKVRDLAEVEVLKLKPSEEGPLGALLDERLPGLPGDQRALLLGKAAGNFLTLTENIGYLEGRERYFEHGRLTDAGVRKVEAWESERERRVEQRFEELGEECQKVLGWGAGSPLGSRFVEEVAVRVAEGGGVDAPREHIAKCAVPLAVLDGGGVEGSPRPLREFQDRAYFRVANKFFEDELADPKGGSEPLDGAVREVLSAWVDACFDADGALVDGRGESLLWSASAAERADVLEAACEALPFDADGDWSDGPSAAGLRAACLLARECVRAGLWDRFLRAARQNLEGICWGSVPDKVLGQDFRWELLVDLLRAHAFKAAHGLGLHLVGIWRELLAGEAGSPNDRRGLADSLNVLGLVQRESDDWGGAAESLREALVIQRELAGETGSPDARRDLAASLNILSVTQGKSDDLGGAAESAREALVIQRELAGETGSPYDRWRLAASLNVLGLVQRESDDWGGAAESLREALGIWRELAGETGSPDDRRGLAASLKVLSVTQGKSDDLGGAAESAREALVIQRELAGETGSPDARRGLAASLYNLGWVQRESDDWGGAAESLREALGIWRELLAGEAGSPDDRRGLAASLYNLGLVQRKSDDWGGAAESLREALVIQRELAGETGSPDARRGLAASLYNLGWVQRKSDDWGGAAESLREALVIQRELAGETGSPDARRGLAASLYNLGWVQRKSDGWGGAAESLREALGIWRELAGETGSPDDRRGLADSLNVLGWVQRGSDDLGGAAESLREALGIRRALGDSQAVAELKAELEELENLREGGQR